MIYALYRKRLSPLLISCLISLSFFAIFFIVFTPTFETNDDFMMKYIINGSYTGTPESRVVFINTILSHSLSFLYTYVPFIDWYSGTWYTTLFISFLTLLYTAVSSLKQKIIKLLFLLVVIIFYLRFMLFLQFTTTAAAATISGLYLYFYTVSSKEKSILFLHTIIGFLLLMGSLIRFDAFLLIVILGAPLVLYSYRIYKANRKQTATFFLIFIGVLVLTRIIDHLAYQSDPSWSSYVEFQKWRGYFHLHELFNYHDNKTVYDTLGWDYSDYYMLTRWFYMDEKQFSANNIKYIVEAIKYKTLNGYILYNSLITAIRGLFKAGSYLFIMISFLILLRSIVHVHWKKYVLTTCIFSLGVILHFSYVQWLPERVVLPIIFFCVLTSFLFISSHDYKKPQTFMSKMLFIYICCMFGGMWLMQMHNIIQRNRHNVQRAHDVNIMITALPSSNKSLTFIWGPSFPFEYTYVFDPGTKLRNKNLLIGLFLQRIPYDYHIMKRFNITNLYRTLYLNPHLYLVAFPQDIPYLTNLIEHRYGEQVTTRKIVPFTLDYETSYLYKIERK